MTDVAMIGTGAIGGVIASWLDAGRIPGHRLLGTLTRSGRGEKDVATLDDLLALAPGLVIEAASQEAARTHKDWLVGMKSRFVREKEKLKKISTGYRKEGRWVKPEKDPAKG